MSGAPPSSERLAAVLERPRGVAGLVDRLSRGRAVGRRGVLVGAAVAGSALVTDPRAYALRPQSAYATVCGPASTASSGWSVFCATINGGVNACPPGSFTAGWWKAADSSWCGGGYRYIVDCNAQCTRCTSGCSDHLCDSRCWNCSCRTGSSSTCDQRRVCCNSFRYGQCNTQVSCSGGVHCRVVSCLPPYQWENCSTTSFRSDSTAEHSSPYLPAWGPMERLYMAMGGHRSYLRASRGPVRSVSDGRGRYVDYQGGRIWWTSATGASAMTTGVLTQYSAGGGPGVLGYPRGAPVTGLRDSGWLQPCERGGLVDSGSTALVAVHGTWWNTWVATGREEGVLGYPTGRAGALTGGAMQGFQGGYLVDGPTGTQVMVLGAVATAWVQTGRETGPLGFPYRRFRRERVPLDGTSGPSRSTAGVTQRFQGGGVWGRNGQAAHAVWGTALAAWQREGGTFGRYGYPTAHAEDNGDGTTTGTFEGGTLTT